MTRLIEIVVAPSGASTVRTQSFTGSACREASRFIEQALGARISERVTPEFHSSISQEQWQQQRW